MDYEKIIQKLFRELPELEFWDASKCKKHRQLTLKPQYGNNRGSFIEYTPDEGTDYKPWVGVVVTAFDCPERRFITILHEVGHYQSWKQGKQPNQLKEEEYAWVWALEYCITHEIEITPNIKEWIGECYCSYVYGLDERYSVEWMKKYNIPWTTSPALCQVTRDQSIYRDVPMDVKIYEPTIVSCKEAGKLKKHKHEDPRIWVRDYRQRW